MTLQWTFVYWSCRHAGQRRQALRAEQQGDSESENRYAKLDKMQSCGFFNLGKQMLQSSSKSRFIWRANYVDLFQWQQVLDNSLSIGIKCSNTCPMTAIAAAIRPCERFEFRYGFFHQETSILSYCKPLFTTLSYRTMHCQGDTKYSLTCPRVSSLCEM